MATGNFRLKTDSELNTIYYRLRNGKNCDYEIALENLKCPKGRWSVSRQLILANSIVNYSKINQTLSDLNSYILQLINNDTGNKIKYSTKWLRLEVFTFLERIDKLDIEQYKVNVIDFFNHYKSQILPLEKGLDGFNNLAQQTQKNFKSAYSKYFKFEEDIKSSKISFLEFNDDLLEEYKSFLLNKERLAASSVNKYIKTLLSVLNHATKLEYFKNKLEYKAVPERRTEEKDPYLTFEEIDKIISLELTGYLDNARDWLIVGCETGLRVSDLLRLNEDFLDGTEQIKIKTKKTNQDVNIPISVRVRNILEKNNGFPRKISSQKFNEYIKKVCKQAEINQPIRGTKLTDIVIDDTTTIKRKVSGSYKKYELISSHTCRRSFATNWYKLNILPNHVIMAITGHKSESVFLNYIKMTQEERVNEFAETMRSLGR